MSFLKGVLVVGDGLSATQYLDFPMVTFSPEGTKEIVLTGYRWRFRGRLQSGRDIREIGGVPIGSVAPQ